MQTLQTHSPAAGRPLTVLGMHRSGTSMLVGTLHEAGVFLGNVYDDSLKYNRKGLLEPKAVLFMQEDLLKANGGSWSEPPQSIEWKNLHLAVRDLFIESRQQQPLWGFKDPRTLLTFEGWRSALPSLEPIGIFRHPAEVAGSLSARNGFSLEKSLDLWRQYNERLLKIHSETPFPVIEFHSSADLLRAKLSELVEMLRLPRVPSPSELSFFEDGIRRNEAAGVRLPAAIEDLYCKLQAIAL
jgi:hypothetical protein